MSHGEDVPDDYLYLDPKEVLSQYSVEWVALRKSYKEIQANLSQVRDELNDLDKQLENKEISEREHNEKYREKWLQSTQMVQVKREVESRLYEIQREIRAANKQLKEQEAAKRRRERIEQEKTNAMIEWMSLKQGFDLIMGRRKEITSEMDDLELKRRSGKVSDEEYRKARVDQIRRLAELRTLENDVKGRLSELLEVVRK